MKVWYAVKPVFKVVTAVPLCVEIGCFYFQPRERKKQEVEKTYIKRCITFTFHQILAVKSRRMTWDAMTYARDEKYNILIGHPYHFA
jgi:hypothetical protein